MTSINNYHFFVFCIHNNKVYVFQSFIGKYLPKLFIFNKRRFLHSLYSLFFDLAFIRDTGQQKPSYSYPNFSRAFSFLTGVHYDLDPHVDILVIDSCPSGFKILSTVVLRFLDITDNIQCLSEPESERGSKRKLKKKKSRKRKKTKKKSRKR